MADIQFKDYLITILLAGLFLFAFYSFAQGIGAEYGHANLYGTDKVDIADLQAQLNDTSNQAQGWEKAFTSDNFFVSAGSIVLFSVWGVFKLMWSSFNAIFTIFKQGIVNVLGLDPMVVGIIGAIIIIGLIFSAWKVIKQGD